MFPILKFMFSRATFPSIKYCCSVFDSRGITAEVKIAPDVYDGAAGAISIHPIWDMSTASEKAWADVANKNVESFYLFC